MQMGMWKGCGARGNPPIPLAYILNIFNQFSLRFVSLARYLQGRTASSGGEARLDAGHPNALIIILQMADNLRGRTPLGKRVRPLLGKRVAPLLGKRVAPLWAKGSYPFRQKVRTPLGKRVAPLWAKGSHPFGQKVKPLLPDCIGTSFRGWGGAFGRMEKPLLGMEGLGRGFLALQKQSYKKKGTFANRNTAIC